MPEFQDILTSRRTIYRFSDEKIDTETLELAFDAARNAPCHKNTHPWKFYVMGKEARKEIIPEVGDMCLFPHYLMHEVYPFNTDGERRSISFKEY